MTTETASGDDAIVAATIDDPGALDDATVLGKRGTAADNTVLSTRRQAEDSETAGTAADQDNAEPENLDEATVLGRRGTELDDATVLGERGSAGSPQTPEDATLIGSRRDLEEAGSQPVEHVADRGARPARETVVVSSHTRIAYDPQADGVQHLVYTAGAASPAFASAPHVPTSPRNARRSVAYPLGPRRAQWIGYWAGCAALLAASVGGLYWLIATW